MTAQPNLGDRVRLANDETRTVFRVVSVYIEGDAPWVALQVGEEKSSKGLRIHRAVADLVAEGGR